MRAQAYARAGIGLVGSHNAHAGLSGEGG
jgi:hypothetical protein